MVPPAAPPLAALQAAINAAAGLRLVYIPAVDVGSRESKTMSLSHGQVGINRWAGASSDQGFSAARQRAKRGVSHMYGFTSVLRSLT